MEQTQKTGLVVFNPRKIKATADIFNNFEDKVKTSAYANLEDLATEIVRRNEEVEVFNSQLDEMNSAEIAHNKEVKARWEAKEAEYNSISTSEEFILMDAATNSKVQNVKIIERETLAGVKEVDYLYQTQTGNAWKDIDNLITAKGDAKKVKAMNLIDEILGKRAKAKAIEEELVAIGEEQKELPYTAKRLDLKDLFELSQGLGNNIIREQVKGDYSELLDALLNESTSASLEKARKLIESKTATPEGV